MQLATLLSTLERVMRLRGVRRRQWVHDGTPVVYHEVGRRHSSPLVLVHGLGTNWLSWAKVVLRLGRTHHVYAIDLPGWGSSPFAAGRDHATISELAHTITGFLKEVVREPVVVIGQSLGGWVSAKVAARNPELVRQLVLTNNAGVYFPEVTSLRKTLDLQTHAEVVEFWQKMWHRVPSTYRYFTDDYVAKMHEPRVLKFLDSIMEADFINEDLPALPMPVSIIWGMSDRFIPITTVDVMLERLPDARVYWLPECGHIPALEKPRQYVRTLEAALWSAD